VPGQEDKSGPRPTRNRIGGYELVAKLGQGGMGAVFKATQLSIGRTVALKILPPRLAKNKEYVARFFREARSAAKLNHPNIVQAIDAGEADGYDYFAMEFIEGRSVEHMLKAGGALSEEQALEIVRDIGRALDYAHDANIIHRDIKPGNILLTTEGTAKLADLGLAREATSQATNLTQAGFAIGTPDYISPEQVRGETEIDGRSDVYSLGATLYEMLTGLPPFAGGSANEVMAKHLAEPTPNAHRADPEVSTSAARIASKAMAKEPGRRYQTAGEMVGDIERALAGGEVSAPVHAASQSRREPHAPDRERGGKALLLVGGLVAAAAVAIALIILLRPKPPTPRPIDPGAEHVPDERPKNGPADAKLLAALRGWTKHNPDKVADAIKRYELALPRMSGAEARSAKADLGKLRRRLRDAADKAFASIAASADRFAQAGDYDGALSACRRLPDEYASVLADKAEAKIAQLRAAAESELSAAIDAARGHLDAKRPEEGLAELNRVKNIRYAPLRADVQDLREHLEGLRRTADTKPDPEPTPEARAAIGKLLEQIEAAAARGELLEAGRLAEAALKNKDLAALKGELEPVTEVGRILGDVDRWHRAALLRALRGLVGKRVSLQTVKGTRAGEVKQVTDDAIVLDRSFKIGGEVRHRPDETVPINDLTEAERRKHGAAWTPRSQAGHIAAVLIALPGKDATKVAALLENAKEHPLHSRYATRLEALTRDAVEQAARDAWKKLAAYLDKPFLTAEEANAVRPALETFKKKHGATQFAISIAVDLKILAGAAANPKREFNTRLPLEVLLRTSGDGGIRTDVIGTTPVPAGDRLLVPTRGIWFVKPRVEAKRPLSDREIRDVALLLRRERIPGVSLSRHSTVTDEHVALLCKARHLRLLGLRGTAVTDRSLGQIGALKELEVLTLMKTRITDAGLARLRGLGKLRQLDLSRTAASDAGLAHLRGLKTLESLDLRRTKVTNNGVRSLQRTLPGLQISR